MDADELEDYLEVRDPHVQERIRKSNEDIRAGRFRPLEEFIAELQASLPPRTRSGGKGKKRQSK